MAAEVRQIGPEDWQIYRRVRLAALKEAPYAFGSTYAREVKAPEATWRQGLRNRTRFVAEVDGEVVGTVSGGEGADNNTAAVTAMWVDPRFRRQGIGDLLLRTVLDWATEHHFRRVDLWVTEGNGNAERLYRRHGFKRTGARDHVRPGEVEHEMSLGL